MRIVGAIPNYNGGQNVARLAQQLVDERLDQVIVLDDASTDDSLELLSKLNDKITLVKGDTNLGPAGNRNRALPYLQDEDIVIFIDADMQLMSRNLRHSVEGFFKEEPHVALVGGGIMNKASRPMTYNYGVHTSHFGDSLGVGLERLAVVLHFKFLVRPLMGLARRYTRNLDIRWLKPKSDRVDWVSEGHCYVRANVLKQVGGFDANLRYHEGKELAWRIRRAGWGVLFAPRLWTRHLEFDVRGKSENQLRVEYAPQVEQKIRMMLKKYETSEEDDPFKNGAA